MRRHFIHRLPSSRMKVRDRRIQTLQCGSGSMLRFFFGDRNDEGDFLTVIVPEGWYFINRML